MFRVINHSSALKTIFDQRHRAVTIPRKGERPVDLSPETAKYLRKLFEHGSKLEVKDQAGEEIDETIVDQLTAPEQLQAPEHIDVKELSLVNDLLSRVTNITAAQFRAEAKEILGDKWPAGSIPNREGIIKLLRDHEEGQLQ